MSLTTSTFDYSGTSANDIYNAPLETLGGAAAMTLQPFTSINGAGGTNTVNAVLNGSVTPLSLANIQNVNATTSVNATLGLINAASATNVQNVASIGELTFSGLAAGAVNLSVTSPAAGADTVFAYASTTGTQSVNLAVDNLSTAAGPDSSAVTINGIETIAVTAVNHASTFTLNADTATTVTIAGSQNLTMAGAAVATLIDGTNFTGNLTTALTVAGTLNGGSGSDTLTGGADVSATISGGAGNDSIIAGGIAGAAHVDSMSGGAGNDTFTFAAGFTTADTVDGGTGTNTLSIIAIEAETASAATPTTYTVSNIQNLTLAATVGAGATSDVINAVNIATSITTVATANATGATAASLTFNAGASTLNLGGLLGGALTVSDTGTATTDSLTIVKNYATNDAALGTVALTVNGFETLNINGGSTAVATTQTTGAIALNGDSTTGALNVNVSGANEVDVGVITTNSTGLLSINLSGVTAQASGTTATLAAAVHTGGTASITGSAGNDVISVDTTTDYASTIKGGAGNDSITGGTAADSIEGEAGNDTIVGGGGNDTLRGGDGNDTITGTGVDSIDGGAGNDTFVMTNTLTAADTIDGGTGVNTLSITEAILSPTVGGRISNVQTLNFAGDVVAQDLSMFTATTLTRVDSLVGNNDIAISNAAATLAELRSTSNSNGTGVVFSFLTDTSSNTLTYGAASDAASTVAKLTANDVETLTIGQGALSTLRTVELTSLVATDLVTLNVGYGNFVGALADQGTTETFTTLNAAANTGTVNFSIADQDVTGASLTGSATAANTLTGGAAADTITGGTAVDSLTGGAGNDVVVGGGGGDALLGNAGNDTITGGTLVDTITGGTGADVMTGGLGNDSFVFASTSDTGLASTGLSFTTTATLDKITVNAGDTITLSVDTAADYDDLMTLQTSGAISGSVTANYAQQVSGIYDSSTGNFTVGSVGANATLVQWAVTTLGTTATQSIVLIGVTSATGMTDGVITV